LNNNNVPFFFPFFFFFSVFCRATGQANQLPKLLPSRSVSTKVFRQWVYFSTNYSVSRDIPPQSIQTVGISHQNIFSL
jgi:hypothetical protein